MDFSFLLKLSFVFFPFLHRNVKSQIIPLRKRQKNILKGGWVELKLVGKSRRIMTVRNFCLDRMKVKMRVRFKLKKKIKEWKNRVDLIKSKVLLIKSFEA